jgi:hypothetical protein
LTIKFEMRITVLSASWLACALLVAGPAIAGRATTDLADIPDEPRAMMAKERARTSNIKADSNDAESGSNRGALNSRKGGCSIDVGNTNSRPGQINSKPTPVIITGPVVQLCK